MFQDAGVVKGLISDYDARGGIAADGLKVAQHPELPR